jgi:hypothetical protein
MKPLPYIRLFETGMIKIDALCNTVPNVLLNNQNGEMNKKSAMIITVLGLKRKKGCERHCYSEYLIACNTLGSILHKHQILEVI